MRSVKGQVSREQECCQWCQGGETGEGVQAGVQMTPRLAQLTVQRWKSKGPAGSHSTFPQDVRVPRGVRGGHPSRAGCQDACKQAGRAEDETACSQSWTEQDTGECGQVIQ